jgi:hypothetical protein
MEVKRWYTIDKDPRVHYWYIPRTYFRHTVNSMLTIVLCNYRGYKANPPLYVRIYAGGCNAIDRRKDKQAGGPYFLPAPLSVCSALSGKQE